MAWFRKKVEIGLPQPDGTTRRVKVPERTWHEWVREGKVRPLSSESDQSGKAFSEGRAAEVAVKAAMENAAQAWPTLMANFQSILDRPLGIRDESQARRAFALAIIALELNAVDNLFPGDQARRLEDWTIRVSETIFGSDAGAELTGYYGVFRAALDDPQAKEMPHDALWWRLLEQWLGTGLNAHEVEFDGRPSGFINPMLPTVISEVVFAPPFLRTWKEINETYSLVEGF